MPDTIALPPAPASLSAEERSLPLTFTGSGGEYFRIWIVNLLLTIITFGFYGAWAKVRRLQYFDRNTTLDGAAFDFHGEPTAILKGRILALVMVLGYQSAFKSSVAAGLVVFGALVLILPWLLRGALGFRLHHTSWRGLRFGFTGTVRDAYAAFLPPMLIILLPGIVVAALAGTEPRAPSPWIALVLLPYLAWPIIHANVKRYQHANVRFGGADSVYTLRSRRFWPPYLIAFAIGVGAMAVVGVVVALIAPQIGKPGTTASLPGPLLFLLFVAVYIAVLSTIPYVQARLGNLVWSHSGFPGLTISSDLTFGGLFLLHAVNTVLTLLTLGLFRPFAVVRTRRYMLAHLHIRTTRDIDALIDARKGARTNAAGDGVADFAGMDFAL